ncbi:PIN/TRAM domain-containing protein [Alkaliphilus oremlandii]|uniref:PilT protein domain protein n=1 Tax=Alkaliphilus oremlandii (strain OhILAs) TaxID=350688 RepID=A8MLA9_ALKOO|nr:PIN/TRAM domain-containing protein [Alkaliphilus oremlandii]ABW18023.1 PilT protein domain protein [Alkaliphilus oremlandii OhILAs]
MINKIIRGILTALGAVAGMALYIYIVNVMAMVNIKSDLKTYIIGIIISSLTSGAMLFILSPWLIRQGRNIANWIEKELSKVPTVDILLGSVGLIIGLIIAYLISNLITGIVPFTIFGSILSTIIYIFMAYLGVKVATKKIIELPNIQEILKRNLTKEKASKKENQGCPKVLDTSVIIDGRIADICRTGFVEGPLIIPGFVLEELRHIADSSDALKRNRGRRGLDILNMIQKELDIEVKMYEKDFPDIAEVDTKLLKLAQVLDGKVITNDYNLNKVAEFQGVAVLNINELANAVKPVVLPGEEMIVQVVKDGKESGQGLAYLDDGTMIVVESGKKYIGQTIDVLVTSVLQTAAGRMIFAKPKALVERSA